MSGQVAPGANGDIFNNLPRPNVPRSKFNLSFVHTTSMDIGELKPFALYDCIKSDDFTIKNIIKLESLPMVSPLWQSLKLRTWWFFVPYSCLWNNFDRFIQGGRDGNYIADMPKIGGKSDVIGSYGDLIDSFCFPIGQNLKDAGLSAFPFMAYQRIYRDFFLNQDVQTSTNINEWFPQRDDDFTLLDGYQTAIKPDIDSPEINLLEKRYLNFERDYFTAAMFSPQRGSPVAMPVDIAVGDDVPLTFSFPVSNRVELPGMNERGIYFGSHSAEIPTAEVVPIAADQIYNGSQTVANPNAKSSYDIFYSSRNKEKYIPFKVSKNDLSNAFGVTSAGFLIDDLRLATQLQIWLERNMRIQAKIQEFYPAHFGSGINDFRVRGPYFIGGSSQILTLSEILQQSESTEESPLGTSAGVLECMSNDFIGKFNVPEFGLIMGLAAIVPDVMYINQGLPREWTKETRFDFFFPEFANLSPQAILSQELYFDADDVEGNKTVYGYTDVWNEYRQRRNLVSGVFGDKNVKDFYTYTMARVFESRPTLSEAFISTKGNIRHDMFTAGDLMPPFKVQFGVDCRAVRAMPYQPAPAGLL